MFRFVGMSREGPLEKAKFWLEVWRTIAEMGLVSTLTIGSYLYGRYTEAADVGLAVAKAMAERSQSDAEWRAEISTRMGRIENTLTAVFIAQRAASLPTGEEPNHR